MIKIISTCISFLWISILYLGIYGIVFITSDNVSMKHTPMHQVFADLYFYYDQNKSSQYYNRSSDLYNNKWTSTQYPNQGYSTVGVTASSVALPASQTIAQNITNITVHSH